MFSIDRALRAAILLGIAAAAPLGAQSTPAQKFAYVNTEEILSQAPGRTEADARFQKDLAVWQAQVKKMGDSLNTMIADFQKVQGTLTTAARDQRQKLIQERQAEYQQRTTDLQNQAQQRQNELMQPILDQIKLVLEDMRVEGGYTFIFDVAQGGGIVAADKNLNLSDRVIAKLRTMPAPTVAAKGVDAPAKAAGAPLSAPAGLARPGTQPPAKRPDSTATKKPGAPA